MESDVLKERQESFSAKVWFVDLRLWYYKSVQSSQAAEDQPDIGVC
jgi:hypothetical protein